MKKCAPKQTFLLTLWTVILGVCVTIFPVEEAGKTFQQSRVVDFQPQPHGLLPHGVTAFRTPSGVGRGERFGVQHHNRQIMTTHTSSLPQLPTPSQAHQIHRTTNVDFVFLILLAPSPLPIHTILKRTTEGAGCGPLIPNLQSQTHYLLPH